MTFFDKYGVEFSDDLKTLVKCPSDFKGEYTIPECVTTIESYAFYYCESLVSVTFPNNLIEIGENAFESCSSLIKLNIPDSVIKIGDMAFRDCINLKEIKIGRGITTLGFCVFENCCMLSNLLIPNNITSIGLGTFSGCKALTSIKIPKSVNNISLRAFGSCPSIESIVVDDENLKYDSRQNCNAIIETSSGKLIMGCKTTIIPHSVISIGSFAFIGCSESINVPSSVSTIDDNAFNSVPIVFYTGFADGSPWGAKEHIK